MMRARPWLGASTSSSTEPSVRGALLETFEHFSPRRPPLATLGLRTAVVLDDGTGALWTVKIEGGRFSLQEGRAKGAEATIAGDPLTLVGIVRGKRSGVEAFLRGRLRVRGNLSLALKLDGIFDRRDRPSDRSRPRRVVAEGIDTFYLEAGSGPPVIVLHGLGATNASMLPTIVALSADHRVLAPDLPGFGDSGKPNAAYDPAFFARWLTSFMDAVGVSRAHLVGNSMGGRIALETALVAPHRVDSLALLAPSVAFRKFRHAVPVVRFLSPQMGAVPVPLLRPYIDQGLRLLFAKPERLHPSWYDAAVDEFMRVFRTPAGRVALFAAARQIYLERPFGPRGFWPRLRELRTPALFLWGDRDRLVPAGFARHVEETLPGARSILLEDCGHVPQFEHPDLTHRHVRDFLSDAAGTARSTGSRVHAQG
jgi:pimeloyl-ACP methyl ester carboxylesterase